MWRRASEVVLVIYPGEGVNGSGQVVGHIYVEGSDDKFEVAGGPPTTKPIPGDGGHTATRTPAGHYILDKAEHHTTSGWPNSVVPWGAKIREAEGIVEFELGGKWLAASGPFGKVTRAFIAYFHRSRTQISTAIASRYARQIFYDSDGNLVQEWRKNDFGEWSWNLKRNGARTVFFIHTTPKDEAAGDNPFDLWQSHGCLHIRPKDRKAMQDKGYLAEGVTVIIKRYDERRPR